MMSLGLGAARLMERHAEQLSARVRMPAGYRLVEQADGFFKKHLHETPLSKPLQKDTFSVGQKFNDMVERGHQPEYLVVTQKDVILDLEAVERNAFQEALQEAENKSRHAQS